MIDVLKRLYSLTEANDGRTLKLRLALLSTLIAELELQEPDEPLEPLTSVEATEPAKPPEPAEDPPPQDRASPLDLRSPAIEATKVSEPDKSYSSANRNQSHTVYPDEITPGLTLFLDPLVIRDKGGTIPKSNPIDLPHYFTYISNDTWYPLSTKASQSNAIYIPVNKKMGHQGFLDRTTYLIPEACIIPPSILEEAAHTDFSKRTHRNRIINPMQFLK